MGKIGIEIYLHRPKSLFTFVINQSNKIEKRSEFSNTLKNARGRPQVKGVRSILHCAERIH